MNTDKEEALTKISERVKRPREELQEFKIEDVDSVQMEMVRDMNRREALETHLHKYKGNLSQITKKRKINKVQPKDSIPFSYEISEKYFHPKTKEVIRPSFYLFPTDDVYKFRTEPIDLAYHDIDLMREDLILIKPTISKLLEKKYIIVSESTIEAKDEVRLNEVKNSTKRVYISEDIKKDGIKIDYNCYSNSNAYKADMKVETDVTTKNITGKVDTGAGITSLNIDGIKRGVAKIYVANGDSSLQDTFSADISIDSLKTVGIQYVKMARDLVGMDYIENKILHYEDKLMTIVDKG